MEKRKIGVDWQWAIIEKLWTSAMIIFSVTLALYSDNPVSNGFWKTPLGALRLTIRSLDTSCPFRKRQIWKTIALCSIFLSLYMSKIPFSQLIMTRMLVKDFDRGFDSKFEASSHQLHCRHYEIDDCSAYELRRRQSGALPRKCTSLQTNTYS